MPFGEELSAGVGGRTVQKGYAADDVRQKFTGKERDSETGLDYFGARYYSSSQGRFTSPDPFGPWAMTEKEKVEFFNGPQQWNRYSYVTNNPLRFTDPTGMERYADNVDRSDRDKIHHALEEIARNGTADQQRIARFILKTDVLFTVEEDRNASGSSGIFDAKGANEAIASQCLTQEGASKFVSINIARQTLNNGEVDLEGTLVHEGKHVDNDTRTISTLSSGDPRVLFNPTQYQNEYSAHLTSAQFLLKRGGEYTQLGLSLGILRRDQDGQIGVSEAGIRARIRENYTVKGTDVPLSARRPGPSTTTAAGLKPRW